MLGPDRRRGGRRDPEQLDEVIDLGIDRAQGYYISHPLLPNQLEQHILDPARYSPIRLPLPDDLLAV